MPASLENSMLRALHHTPPETSADDTNAEELAP